MRSFSAFFFCTGSLCGLRRVLKAPDLRHCPHPMFPAKKREKLSTEMRIARIREVVTLIVAASSSFFCWTNESKRYKKKAQP